MMVHNGQQKEERIFFINKSASDTSLSHSSAEEGLDIRRFIQRRNRRIERATKTSLSCYTQGQLPQRRTRSNTGSSSNVTLDVAEVFDTTYQYTNVSARGNHSKCFGRPKGWIIYSATASSPKLLKPSLASKMHHRESTCRGGKETIILYNSIQERAWWSPAEHRGSDYFVRVIASKFTATECSVFWGVFLPCIFEEDFCVRLLVTGFALVHESYDLQSGDPQRAKGCHEEALRYYNRAMKHIREHAETLPKTALDMTCILIVSIEMLRGNLLAAEACLDSGLAMAGTSRAEIVERRWKHPVSLKASTSLQRAIEVTQAKMAGTFHVFSTRSQRSKPYLKFYPRLPSTNLQIPFMSLEGVNTAAEMLYSATLRAVEGLMEGVEISRGSTAATILLQEFENFHQGLELVRACGLGSMPASEAFMQTLIPEIKVLEAEIVFNCVVLDDDEMSFDNWSLTFEKMLQGLTCKLEQSTSDPRHLTYHPFSAVFITPLWLIASRCRIPSMRRDAIHLLRTYRRRETVHDSLVAANLAQHIVTMEEGSEVQIRTCSDIRRSHRVRLEAVEYISTRRCVRLEYARGFANHTETKTTVKELSLSDIASEWWRDDKAMSSNALLQSMLIYSRGRKISTKSFLW